MPARRGELRPPSLTGVAVAALAFAASTGPSLVPRGWLFQGIISGFALMFGYAAGTAARAILGTLGLRAPKPDRRRRIARLIWVGFAVVLIVTVLTGGATQRRLAALWGVEQVAPLHAASTLAVALALVLVLVASGRGLRVLVRRLHRLLGRVLAPAAAGVAAAVIVLGLVTAAMFATIEWVILGAMTDYFTQRDSTTRPGVEQPDSPLRSGSAESTQAWESLGYEGRNFVAGGPDATAITAFTGEDAVEPIRVYAGLASQGGDLLEADLDAVAREVLAELDRTNAWDREVLAVVTTTGTGWVDPASPTALEYLHGGNTAVAAMQYSVNPSWVTLLLDRDRPTAAGRALFEAIHARWSQLPEADRPQLVSYGVSLGSYGSQGAFDSLADVTGRSDGAIWTGTPRFTRLWQEVTGARDAGSPETHPVLDGGATVRWGTQNGGDQGLDDLGPSQPPRIAYLQHPSDGVVWWWLRTLVWPDPWFSEEPGQDVLPGVRWWPVISGLQLTGDMFVAGGATIPLGYGHNYAQEYVDAWAWVTGTDKDPERLARLRELVSGRG